MSDKSKSLNQLSLSGIHCGGCVNTIQKALTSVEGVTNVEVDLLKRTAKVIGNVDSKELIQAVEKAGFGAKPIFDNNQERHDDQ